MFMRVRRAIFLEGFLTSAKIDLFRSVFRVGDNHARNRVGSWQQCPNRMAVWPYRRDARSAEVE